MAIELKFQVKLVTEKRSQFPTDNLEPIATL